MYGSTKRLLIAAILIMGGATVSASSTTPRLAQDAPTTWADHAQPVFRARCAACHNPDKKSGDLDVTSYAAIMAGGASGASIEPGDPGSSYLFSLVSHTDEPSMPPGGTKIPDEEIATLERWIAGGAMETATSTPRKGKKKTGLAASSVPAANRPDPVPQFPRLPLEPAVTLDRGGAVTGLAAHPWAAILAVAVPGQVLLFDAGDLGLRGVLPFPEGQARVLKFSRSGSVLLAGGGKDAASGKVVLWDVATGRRITTIGDELDVILAADISSDHRLVALGGPQKSVRVYSADDGKLLYELKKHTDWITALEFSPDGVLLATGDRNGGLFVWHAPTGNEYLTLAGHTAAITATTWRLDSNLLVSASEDTSVRAWELENGGQVKALNPHSGGVTSAAYDRDGNLVTIGRDRLVKLWNPAGDPLMTFPELPDIGTAAVAIPEAGRIAGIDWQGNAVIWNAEDAAEVGRLDLLPRPLDERLSAAQQARDALAAEHKAASETMGGLQAAQQTAMRELDAAKTEAGTVETKVSAMREQLAKLEAEQGEINVRKAELEAEAAALTTILPELETLAAQAAKVAGLAPDDAQLGTASTEIAGRLEASKARSAAIIDQQAKDTARAAELVAGMETGRAGLEREEAAMGPLAETIATLQGQLDTANQAVAAAQAQLQELTTRLANADAAVARWQGELEFVAALDQLEQQLVAADDVIDEAATAEAAVREELAAVQVRVDAAAVRVSEAEQSRAAVQQRLDQLQGIGQ